MFQAVSMMVILMVAFILMAKRIMRPSIVLSLTACLFLVMDYKRAEDFLTGGFENFAEISVAMTCVAIPVHLMKRSFYFEKLSSAVGYFIGVLHFKTNVKILNILVFLTLFGTYVSAALFHNITSILIWVPLTILLCQSYRIPSLYLFCGELVASNLGGFSTSWGDTPNITEARVWNLTSSDFMVDILPVNILLMAILGMVVIFLINKELKKRTNENRQVIMENAITLIEWTRKMDSIRIDKRMFVQGVLLLSVFILLQWIWPNYMIPIGVGIILLSVLVVENKERLPAMTCLGFECYLAFAGIFIIADVFADSLIGKQLFHFIEEFEGAPWVIGICSYIGTLLTGAASWAAATSEAIHSISPDQLSAWMLGGGICAGSSSLITSASAGILLISETAKYGREFEVSFDDYLRFGFVSSLFMLGFYILWFSFIG